MDENSTGYEQHPAQIIKEIRGNLHERYQSGFPILKELIQNADDAENASEFHFGWSPGLEGSIHPLAQAPAIFFLNNGDFRPEHENAIKRFNYGSKALDKASVGKFGLGTRTSHCYVPSSRVRNFFSQLGCELDGQQGAQISTLIHEFIVRFLDEDRATFQHSFDLPFIRLLDSREKQIEILGRGIEEERPLFRWAESFYERGDFITLPDGRVIPRDYTN